MKYFSTIQGTALLILLVVILTGFSPTLLRAAPPEGFETQMIAGGLVLPTAMAFANDGRIFIAEKGGSVKVIKNGALLSEPVITLTDINTFSDRGLIGIAVDPDFQNNGYLYLSYTYENSPGANVGGEKTGRIVRVTVVGDTASESSKVVLVGTQGGTPENPSCEDYVVTADCIPSDSGSHSMGGLGFGLDGKLYATLGDGASFDYVDPRAVRAQNIDSLAGKVLRINTDGTAPSDNPFYNGDSQANRSKVYSYGHRNMFRFTFHPVTGVMFGGDVGWSTWEEVNVITAGNNYGWPCWEGNFETSYGCTSGNTAPTYVYAHDAVGAGSVTAGAFPAFNAYPDEFDNSLFVGDYAQNWIKRLELDENNVVIAVHDFIDNPDGPVHLTTGPDGNIYYLSIYTGEVNRITHTNGNRTPVVEIAASPTSGLLPLIVDFSSVGSFDLDGDPITYGWNFGDGGTSALQNPSYEYTVAGTYEATLTVTDSSGASAQKSITIRPGNQAPVASIDSPSSGGLYTINALVQLQGSATDLEDGVLPASAFEWDIILHHNTHLHVHQQFSGVTNPVFIAPDHSASDVYIEVILTVTDSAGSTDTRSINMYLNSGSGAGNLIANPSVEIPGDGAQAVNPIGWHTGWWGALNPTFTYPVPGFDGSDAVQVSVDSHTSGDAKWYFSPVTVTEGEEYKYSSVYTATVGTDVFAQFGFANGTYQYQYLGHLPAIGTPTGFEYTFSIPVGVRTVSVFHNLGAVGTLVTDNFSLTLVESVPPPPLSNLISNGNLEVQNGASPLDWTPSTWGNHTAVHTYPIVGYDGNRGARVEITQYAFSGTGDSKWAFKKVPVTPGTEYTFSDHYRSSTISDVIGQYTMNDGSFHYFGLQKEIQPTTAWQTLTKSFVPPVGATHVTLFHLISAVGYLEIDDASLIESGSGTPSETEVPVVEFLNPLDGQIVSGTVSVTASSSDNVGITYIFYAVNGIPTTGQLATAPYAWEWDTTAWPDGMHVLKATTHDPSGNNSTHTITVQVDNTTPPTPTPTPTPTPAVNLIANPSLETSSNGTTPDGWLKGGWGTNTRTLTYPVAGDASANAIRTEVTNYTNGDAKWYFTDVPVVPGQIYRYSNTYTSDTQSHVTIRYALQGGTFQYVHIASLAPSAGWALFEEDITIPFNAISMTVFHLLNGAGVLDTDNYSLVHLVAGDPNQFAQGMVSLTFDDGWVSQHANALPILNAAGIKGGFYITTQETSGAISENRVPNSSLETSSNGTTPDGWLKGGWGTNTRTLTYPVAGDASANAIRVEITSYTDGDAKWYFTDTAVMANQAYVLSNRYTSTTNSIMTVRYTLTGGAFQYIDIAQLPAAPTWTTFEQSIVTPANAVSATIFHRIASVGSLTTDNMSFTRVPVFMNEAQVLELQASGHEVGAHTRTHPYLTQMSAVDAQNEIAGSRADLLAMGITTVDQFVYPYGDYNAAVRQMVIDAGYLGARGVERGFNNRVSDPFTLKIQQMGETVTFAQVQSWIDAARANNTWLILMFHQIENTPETLTISPALLQQTVDYLTSTSTSVVTLKEGIGLMN